MESSSSKKKRRRNWTWARGYPNS